MKRGPGVLSRFAPALLVASLSTLLGCAGRAAPRPQGRPVEPDAVGQVANTGETPHAPAQPGDEIVTPGTPASGGPAGASDAPRQGDAPARPPSEPRTNLAESAAGAYIFAPERTVSGPAAIGRPAPDRPPPAGAAIQPQQPRTDEAAPSQAMAESPAPVAEPPGSLRLSIVTTPTAVAPGEIVSVDVIAEATGSIDDAPFRLRFDPAVVAFVDGAPGDFLSQGGSSVVFLVDGTRVAGEVAVAIGRTERESGATGSGLLCRIRLRGVARGDTTLVLAAAKAWDARGEPVAVATGEAAASVR